MATIPSSQKFHTVKSTVDTENRGSASLNAQRTIFTMQDILDTVVVGGGVDGSGTAGKISKWVDSNTLTDSIMAEAGALINLTGGLTATGNLASVDVAASGNISAVDVAASGNVSGVNGVFTTALTSVSLAATGAVSGASLAATGAVTGATVTATGEVEGGTLDINGNASISGTLSDVTTLNVTTVAMTGVLSGATSVTSETLNVTGMNSAPATAGSAGVTGQIRFTTDAIYVCTATNTWKKADILTF